MNRIIVCVVAAALFLSGCMKEKMTEEEYVVWAEDVYERVESSYDNMDVVDAWYDGDISKAEAKQSLERLRSTLREVRDEARGIDPPAPMDAAHPSLIKGLDTLLKIVDASERCVDDGTEEACTQAGAYAETAGQEAMAQLGVWYEALGRMYQQM